MNRALIVKSTGNDPWFNLAFEEYLTQKLKTAIAGKTDFKAILYLWQNQNTVVIGRNQNAWAECKTALLEEEGGFLARRTTGGGAVFHDLGNLNFSLIFPQNSYDIDRNFQMIVDTVRGQGIEAQRSGRNDILVDGLKFSGNAFRMDQGVGLHHGTLLVHSAYERVGRYLTVAPAKLKAKGVASVRSRITNLQALRPDITVEKLSESMEESFIKTFCPPDAGWQIDRCTQQEYILDGHLISLQEQFASWNWRYGESIKFDVSIEEKFDWGHVSIGFQVSQGMVKAARIYSDALDCDFIEPLASLFEGKRFESETLAKAVLSYIPEGQGFGISRQVIAGDLADLFQGQGW